MRTQIVGEYKQTIKFLGLSKPINWLVKDGTCSNNGVPKPKKIIYEGPIRRIGKLNSLLPKTYPEDTKYCIIYMFEESQGVVIRNDFKGK